MARFPDAVNEQIGREFAASQQYIAIAVYYDRETLPKLGAHFYRQAVEERNHAMMLVQYLLDAGESVVIPGVEAPRTEFDDATAFRIRQRSASPPPSRCRICPRASRRDAKQSSNLETTDGG